MPSSKFSILCILRMTIKNAYRATCMTPNAEKSLWDSFCVRTKDQNSCEFSSFVLIPGIIFSDQNQQNLPREILMIISKCVKWQKQVTGNQMYFYFFLISLWLILSWSDEMCPLKDLNKIVRKCINTAGSRQIPNTADQTAMLFYAENDSCTKNFCEIILNFRCEVAPTCLSISCHQITSLITSWNHQYFPG